MPLKRKFALLLILFLLGNGLCVHMYFTIQEDRVEENMTNYLKTITKEVSMKMSRMIQIGKELESLKPSLEGRGVYATIIDPNGKVIYSSTKPHDLAYEVSFYEKLIIDNNKKYEILLIYDLKKTGFSFRETFKQLIYFQIIIIIIMLLIVLYVVDKEVCKPLVKLNQAVDEIHVGKNYYANNEPINEIAKLSRSFAEMAERITSYKKQETELIASMSHDLKTPLTSILGYTERLISPGIEDKEKRRKYYQIIWNKATDIQHMVEELHTYMVEQIENMEKKPIKIKEFLQQLLQAYKEELEMYEVTLESEMILEDTLTVHLDKDKIRRVFTNIFFNAIEHGGVPLEIKVHCFRKQQKLWICIENNGKSISKQEIDKVFELLYTGNHARNAEIKHKGLGLAIVKQIIEKHGGNIQAYCPKNGGFGIQFYIKIEK